MPFVIDIHPVAFSLLGLRTAQWIGLGIGALAIVPSIYARRQTRRPSTPSMKLEASLS